MNNRVKNIIDHIVGRLATITIANGYSTDAGSNIDIQNPDEYDIESDFANVKVTDRLSLAYGIEFADDSIADSLTGTIKIVIDHFRYAAQKENVYQWYVNAEKDILDVLMTANKEGLDITDVPHVAEVRVLGTDGVEESSSNFFGLTAHLDVEFIYKAEGRT